MQSNLGITMFKQFFDFQPLAKISISALKHNAKIVKNNTRSLVCAVVKGDAYGHGLVECVRVFYPYCDYFAVCSLDEGVALRIAGIDKPILCLLPIKNLSRAITYDITVCINSVDYFLSANEFCKQRGVFLNAQIAVNTGMNRLGIDGLNQLKFCLFNANNIKITGVYSHFYNVKNKKHLLNQYQKFLPFYYFAKSFNSDIICHISASGAFSLGEQFHFDMVRVGIVMYGYNAINGTFKLKKAMKVVAPQLQERIVHKGDNLLYGNYKITKEKRVALYAYGYLNGFRRHNAGLLNNNCMNICASERIKKDILIMQSAATLAKALNTIEYEILTSFGNNCKRVYGD